MVTVLAIGKLIDGRPVITKSSGATKSRVRVPYRVSLFCFSKLEIKGNNKKVTRK